MAENGVYVKISGLQKEDAFIRAKVDEEIAHEIRKLARFFPVDQLEINVKKHEIGGKRKKYSLKAKLFTEKGLFFAQEHDWDVTKAAKNMMKKLEREVVKAKEKALAYSRAP